MEYKEFNDKIKHLNNEQICSVHLCTKKKIFGLEWRDERSFLGIRYRKAGVYTSVFGDFWSSNKEELYELPSVYLSMSNNETFKFEFVEEDKANAFHQFTLNLISR